MFCSEVAVQVHGQLNRFMAKDGFKCIHITASFKEVESEAMAQIVTAPLLHSWILLLDSGDRVIDLLPAQQPPELAHESPFRNARERMKECVKARTHSDAAIESALAVLERHVAGREVDVLPLE